MEKLKDIKDIVDVPDYSIYLLIGVTICVVILLFIALYLFKHRRKRRKRKSPKEIALERLKSIDFSDTKSVVYTFEELGKLFLDEKNQSEFESIKKELTIYKYKRDIPPLDSSVESRIKRFIGELK